MIVGMDFGTTNSGMAVYDGQELRRLPLDPASDNPRVLRTALYITNEQDVYIGRDALDRYFAHNVGRPTKLERVWVGEIEVRGADMYFVTDAYVWADVMSRAASSSASRPTCATTSIAARSSATSSTRSSRWSPSTLRHAPPCESCWVARCAGSPGPAVRFADDPSTTRWPRSGCCAALQAGYEKVSSTNRSPLPTITPARPIAPRISSSSTSAAARSTSPSCAWATGGERSWRRWRPSRRRHLRPSLSATLPATLRGQHLPAPGNAYPPWIYDTFSSWQTILELQTPQNRACSTKSPRRRSARATSAPCSAWSRGTTPCRCLTR